MFCKNCPALVGEEEEEEGLTHGTHTLSHTHTHIHTHTHTLTHTDTHTAEVPYPRAPREREREIMTFL